MTTRNPLVRVNGKIVELPAGDDLAGAAPGTGIAGSNGANGGAITIAYTFSTTTTDADPGNGTLRLNNATQNTATTIYADLLDSGGADWTGVLDTFDDSTNTVTGILRLVKASDATKFLVFNVTALTTATGYRKVTVANVGSSSASPFVNGDSLLLCFDRVGDSGAGGGTPALVLISEVTTSGTQSTVTFSSIASTYRDLQIRVRSIAQSGGANAGLRVQINGDTSASYTWAANSSFGGATSSTGATYFFVSLLSTLDSNVRAGAIIDILGYASTTEKKPILSSSCAYLSNPAAVATYSHGIWHGTSAVTSVAVYYDGVNIKDGSIVSLYGHT